MANYVNFFQSAILAPIIMAANVVNADVILKNSLNADLQWKPPTGYGGKKKITFWSDPVSWQNNFSPLAGLEVELKSGCPVAVGMWVARWNA